MMIRLMIGTLEETALKDTKLIEAMAKAANADGGAGETLTESQKDAKFSAKVTWGLAIALIVAISVVAASFAYYADKRG